MQLIGFESFQQWFANFGFQCLFGSVYLYTWHDTPEGVTLGKYTSIEPRVTDAFRWQWCKWRARAELNSGIASGVWALMVGDVWPLKGGVCKEESSSNSIPLRGWGSALPSVLHACSAFPGPHRLAVSSSITPRPGDSLSSVSSSFSVFAVCVCLSEMKFVFQALTDWQGKQGCHFCFVLLLWAWQFLALRKQSWDLGGYNLGCHV